MPLDSLPLSFSEYMQGQSISPQEAWKEYIRTGGIPLVAQMVGSDEKISYLNSLCEETYLKDIIAHNRIKKKTELADTFNIIASMIGSPVNVSKLTNTFKSVMGKDITDDTIANFIGYFEDAFVISKVSKYNIKGRKYIGAPFKLYFEDIGVRNARLNFRQIEETHIMENIIYNELRYRGFNIDVGEVNVSEKTDRIDINGKSIYAQKALEVDFIASKGDIKFYIQSALSMDDVDKQLQEKKSLYYIDVIDPIQHLRGFFQWKNGKVEKLAGYYIYDDLGVAIKVEQPKPRIDHQKELVDSSKPKSQMVQMAFMGIMSILIMILLMNNISLSRKVESQSKSQRSLEEQIISQNATLEEYADKIDEMMESSIIDNPEAKDEENVISTDKSNNTEVEDIIPEDNSSLTGVATFQTYTVKEGDNLEKICSENGLDYVSSYRIITGMNGISDPNKIYVGQKILIPSE